MTYLGYIFAPAFAVSLLVAYPILTLVLMRRAGVRGPKLALAVLPPLFMFVGGYVFQGLMTLDVMRNSVMMIALAKNIGIFIGAISPLLILAIVKWPVLENSRLQVESSK